MKTFALYCISFGVVVIALTFLAHFALTNEQHEAIERSEV